MTTIQEKTVKRTKRNELTFEKSMTYFKKFVSKKGSRPELKYVNFDGGRYLIATDSHKLIRIKPEILTNFPYDKGQFLINPKTMDFDQEELWYPDTYRIVPIQGKENIQVGLDKKTIRELLTTIKEAKQLVKQDKNKTIALHFTYTGLTIIGNEVNGEVIETIYEKTIESITTREEDEEIKIFVNAGYLQHILETAKKLLDVTKENVKIGLISKARPIHFYNSYFDSLLLPIRVGG